MTTEQPSPAGDLPTSTPLPVSAGSSQPLAATRVADGPNPLWWSILAAVLAALVVWGVGESGMIQFKPTITKIPLPGGSYDGPSSGTRTVAWKKEAVVRTALLGGLLGLAVGLVGGLSRKSGRGALLGGTIGLLVGGGLGAAEAWPVLTTYFTAEDSGPGELTRAILMHLGLWLPAGAAVGLGLAVGLGAPKRIPAAVVGGLLGVVLGTIVYEIIGSLVYPLAETGGPVALEWQPRLMAPELVALGAAVGASTGFRFGKQQS